MKKDEKRCEKCGVILSEDKKVYRKTNRDYTFLLKYCSDCNEKLKIKNGFKNTLRSISYNSIKINSFVESNPQLIELKFLLNKVESKLKNYATSKR